ncbi:MAG: MBL fold metallo-hydrolase [Syntrophobacterales bacterium]|nr:MBL fold metallo-hydrolase [Syntrophobacterales bacterium]
MGLRVSRFNDRFIIGHGKVGYLGVNLNVFLYSVDGLLIDTGPWRLANEIKPFLLAFPPKKVVVTHLHEDHCGLAFWINSVYPKVPIYAHGDRIDVSATEAKLPLYRRIFWGRRRPFRAEPYPNIVETDLYSFEIIHVGGHSHDHAILYEPKEGWLFVGDLFLTTRPIVAFYEEITYQTLQALHKMLSLDFSDLFCSHSGHHSNGRELITKKKEYLEELYERVRALKERGYALEEIDRMLFPKKPFIVKISQGEWSSANIIKSIEP